MGTVLRVVLAIGAASFTGLGATAQTPVPDAQRIIHESWTFKDGAPESVQGLAQTADGYLWLGTPSGLFRFDGVRFELFRVGDGNLRRRMFPRYLLPRLEDFGSAIDSEASAF